LFDKREGGDASNECDNRTQVRQMQTFMYTYVDFYVGSYELFCPKAT